MALSGLHQHRLCELQLDAAGFDAVLFETLS